MDYKYLDKAEYSDIPIIRIAENNNNLPFWIARIDACNEEIHRHEYVQIIYVLKGRLTHVINRHSFDVIKGDIFVIPPYVPHYFVDTYGDHFELIEYEFTPEFINEKFSSSFADNSFMDFAYLEPFLVVEQEMRPRLNLTGALQLEVEKIFEEILTEYAKNEIDFTLVIKALTMKLLILVGREFKKDIAGSDSEQLYERHRDALQSAVSFVDTHYNQDISMDQAAKAAMLSPSYFRYLFKQMTGRTFTEYLNNLRINKAIDLLVTRNDIQIIDICYESGYHNVNYFNRIFKQITGVSPRFYRTKHRDTQRRSSVGCS